MSRTVKGVAVDKRRFKTRILMDSMKPENIAMAQQERMDEAPGEIEAASKPTENEALQTSTLDDQLSFLNSLPVVKKPKPEPEQSELDEHLAFLSNLRRLDTQEEQAEPASQPDAEAVITPTPSEEASDSTPSGKVRPTPVVKQEQPLQPTIHQPKKKKVRPAQKNKNASRFQREEKNRREKEKADAKKAEIRKRQQEAALKNGSSSGKSSVPKPKAGSNRSKAKNSPRKKSVFSRFKRD